jgi:hypothetical protein
MNLLIENGIEYAQQIIAQLDHATLTFIAESIDAINPHPESELAMVSNHLARHMASFHEAGAGR